MRRREFITFLGSAAAVWPSVAQAQKSSKVLRVGILSTANPRSFYQAFEQKLRDFGYIEGQNVSFDYRNAGGQTDKLRGMAIELAGLDVDLIVTSTDVATRAAKDATARIPILMVAINYDPIALGFIQSIARPGTNVTGMYFQHLELLTKRLGLFREMLPGTRRVAVLNDPLTADQLARVISSNSSMGFDLVSIPLQNPPYDFEAAFRTAIRANVEALFVLESPSIFRGRAQVAQLAIENKLPTSFAFREYTEVGGLSSYGVNFSTMYRRAAEYADKLMRGAAPADLPVEQSTKFDFVLNLKTAKAIGLNLPSALLATADEVLE